MRRRGFVLPASRNFARLSAVIVLGVVAGRQFAVVPAIALAVHVILDLAEIHV
jgi:hypothetical protein